MRCTCRSPLRWFALPALLAAAAVPAACAAPPDETTTQEAAATSVLRAPDVRSSRPRNRW